MTSEPEPTVWHVLDDVAAQSRSLAPPSELPSYAERGPSWLCALSARVQVSVARYSAAEARRPSVRSAVSQSSEPVVTGVSKSTVKVSLVTCFTTGVYGFTGTACVSTP